MQIDWGIVVVHRLYCIQCVRGGGEGDGVGGGGGVAQLFVFIVYIIKIRRVSPALSVPSSRHFGGMIAGIKSGKSKS